MPSTETNQTAAETMVVAPVTTEVTGDGDRTLTASGHIQRFAGLLKREKANETRALVLNANTETEAKEFTVGMVDTKDHPSLQKIADELEVNWRKITVVSISEDDFENLFLTAYGVPFQKNDSEEETENKTKWHHLVDFNTAGSGGSSENKSATAAAATGAAVHTPSLGERKAQSEKELAEQILRTAMFINASDVHFDMNPSTGTVRLRHDGILYSNIHTSRGEVDFSGIDKRTFLKICGALAAMAKVNYDDMLNAPQDGSFELAYREDGKKLKKTRVRFASIPRKIEEGDQRGVKVTLRLNQKMITNIDELGLEEEVIRTIRNGLNYIGGIGLIVGGTGSGKTNILASMHTILRHGNKKNIMEYGDTIEQMFTGICQTEVSESCTEEAIIKSFLRHDPDIIIGAEVRDDAATKMLVKIATAGKLVLSTLHAASLPEVFVRLEQLGVDRYSQSQTLRFIIFTSLVRKLCQKCKIRGYRLRNIPGEFYEYIANENGCAHCRFLGYRGRTSVTESLCLSPEVVKWIAEGLPGDEICRRAEEKGWLFPLSEAIGRKLAAGITSKAEILRVIDVERRNSEHKEQDPKSKFNWREQPSRTESDEEASQRQHAQNQHREAETHFDESEENVIEVVEVDENNFQVEMPWTELEESEVDSLFESIDKNNTNGHRSDEFDENVETQNKFEIKEPIGVSTNGKN